MTRRVWTREQRAAWASVIAGTITVASFALITWAGVWVAEHARIVSARAEIEQLRSDIAKAGGVVSEDIAGQATAWNQTIRRKQRWTHVPVIGWTVPNAWLDVEIIDFDTGR